MNNENKDVFHLQPTKYNVKTSKVSLCGLIVANLH